MKHIDRREAVKVLAGVSLFALTPVEADAAARKAAAALSSGKRFQPDFFTDHEWRTVRLLVDLVIPADDRSGSATDAGVPEFMDFTMTDRPYMQDGMRQGLSWLDRTMNSRVGRDFVDATASQQTELLDDIAWPDRADPALSDGVGFFNSFRDMTASGFFSSRIGVADVQYIGNTARREWPGCPPEVLRRLGVGYEDAE